MQEPTKPSANPHRWWLRGAAVALILGMVTLVVLNLPRGFDTDLSKIGGGKPALVFVYDSNLVVSNEQTREMDKMREILGEELHFLIADIGRPDAQQFMQQYQARPTQLLLFGANGDLLHKTQSLVNAEKLIELFHHVQGAD